MTTTLISNVTVVDGTGGPRCTADVELADGRIARIADPGTLTASGTSIDGAGLVLSPGFIDMHAHSDLQLLVNPDHYAKLSQGVTTELLGQDGLSYAPVNDEALDLIRQQIAGWNSKPDDFDWDWRTVGEYLDRLDRPDADGNRIATNAAYLIPQGTLRALVVGFDDRPATPDEIAEMQRVTAVSMDEGAIGMSSGLTYTPGMYADTAELEAKVAADPKDHQARFDLALALNARDRREEAVDHLVAIIKADRAWNDDGARKQLLQFFEAWGPMDEASVAGRRKLSTLLFS